MLSSLVVPRPVKSSRLTFGDSTSSNLHMHIAHTSRSGDDKLEKNGDTLLPFDDLWATCSCSLLQVPTAKEATIAFACATAINSAVFGTTGMETKTKTEECLPCRRDTSKAVNVIIIAVVCGAFASMIQISSSFFSMMIILLLFQGRRRQLFFRSR